MESGDPSDIKKRRIVGYSSKAIHHMIPPTPCESRYQNAKRGKDNMIHLIERTSHSELAFEVVVVFT